MYAYHNFWDKGIFATQVRCENRGGTTIVMESDSFKFVTWPVSQPSAPPFPIAHFHNMTHLDFSVGAPQAPINAAIYGRCNSFWTLRRRIVSQWLHNGPGLFWISQCNHFSFPSLFFPRVAFHEPCARNDSLLRGVSGIISYVLYDYII